MRFAPLFVLAAGLAGCQTMQPVEMIWLRTDGQSQRQNPALAQQFEIDKTVCIGELQKAGLAAPPVYTTSYLDAALVAAARRGQGDDIVKGCMANRGYLLVPASEAEARAAELRQATAAGAIVKKPGT